ncbi:MAG: hypothetical protein UT61_C0008G0001, partial [Candidatus Woesebacteria bacterium GW2011_GWA1_39_8]
NNQDTIIKKIKINEDKMPPDETSGGIFFISLFLRYPLNKPTFQNLLLML